MIAYYSCKSTVENFDSHVTDVVSKCVKMILDKKSISVPLLWLPWHQFELDAWC